MAVPSTPGVRRRHPAEGPLGGAQHPAATPRLPAVAVGVGLVLPAFVAAQWGDPWGGLLVAGFLRAAAMLLDGAFENAVFRSSATALRRTLASPPSMRR